MRPEGSRLRPNAIELPLRGCRYFLNNMHSIMDKTLLKHLRNYHPRVKRLKRKIDMDDIIAKEVASTMGKGIDLVRDIGRIISAPVEQIMGIWADKLKYRRWENQIALLEKAYRKMSERGLSPSRQIPLKIAIPLLEYASVEDNENLQDMWANLLVNLANVDSKISIEISYVEILKSLSSLDAQIMQTIYGLPIEINKCVRTDNLPYSADFMDKNNTEHKEQNLSDDIICALANLNRLGCIHAAITFGGGQSFSCVNQTILGKQFFTACALTE